MAGDKVLNYNLARSRRHGVHARNHCIEFFCGDLPALHEPERVRRECGQIDRAAIMNRPSAVDVGVPQVIQRRELIDNLVIFGPPVPILMAIFEKALQNLDADLRVDDGVVDRR